MQVHFRALVKSLDGWEGERPCRLTSLLKRWLLGTHQGGMSREQLDYYLDEFTFRFNRRASRSRGLLFYRLCEGAVGTKPRPYKDLIITSDRLFKVT